MGTKKKNSNYVTEKTMQKKKEKELERLEQKRRRTLKLVSIYTLCVLLLVGAFLLIGAAFGMFDYYPEATAHASVVIEYKGEEYTVHMELYGEDAPQSVAQFKKLVEAGYYDGKVMYQFADGLLYCGGQTTPGYGSVAGEFSENGIENKISHKRGVISMTRGEDCDSADGRFFIVTQKRTDLDGSYAAFGSIIDGGMGVIEKICDDLLVDENGYVTNVPIITSISIHDAH